LGALTSLALASTSPPSSPRLPFLLHIPCPSRSSLNSCTTSMTTRVKSLSPWDNTRQHPQHVRTTCHQTLPPNHILHKLKHLVTPNLVRIVDIHRKLEHLAITNSASSKSSSRRWSMSRSLASSAHNTRSCKTAWGLLGIGRRHFGPGRRCGSRGRDPSDFAWPPRPKVSRVNPCHGLTLSTLRQSGSRAHGPRPFQMWVRRAHGGAVRGRAVFSSTTEGTRRRMTVSVSREQARIASRVCFAMGVSREVRWASL